MIHFCTLFDSNYLLNGLALYESLKKHCEDFHLYIFAFDDRSLAILTTMDLASTTIVSLKEFENKKLLGVKATRTKAEYCWTCTSSAILYVLENYDIEMCTYLDADIYFYSSPKPLFVEMAKGSIMLTEHRYPVTYKWLDSNGKYCVQFISFRKDENGLRALRWWVDSCIDWCYARLEDGKFGDQKYLDDWLDRFEGVHILQHSGGGVAPWNVQKYFFTLDLGNKLQGTEKATENKFELIFYHFHDLKFLGNNKIRLTGAIFVLRSSIRKSIYKPYIEHLASIKNRLLEYGYIDDVKPVRADTQNQSLSRKIKNKIIELSSKGRGRQLLHIKFILDTAILIVFMIKNKFNVYDINKILD
jgi:hypothetical protein